MPRVVLMRCEKHLLLTHMLAALIASSLALPLNAEI